MSSKTSYKCRARGAGHKEKFHQGVLGWILEWQKQWALLWHLGLLSRAPPGEWGPGKGWPSSLSAEGERGAWVSETPSWPGDLFTAGKSICRSAHYEGVSKAGAEIQGGGMARTPEVKVLMRLPTKVLDRVPAWRALFQKNTNRC